MRQENYWKRRIGRRGLLRASLVGSIGAGSMVLVGCGDDDDGSEATPTSPGQSPSAKSTDLNATVRIAIQNAKGGLDPQTPGNFTTTFSPYIHFDRLLETDLSTRKLVPLVSSFEWVSETEAVFKVVPGVKWHDGQPFTAEDVKFSLDRVAGRAPYNADGKYNTGGAYTVAAVDGEVQVVDPETVRVPLKRDATAPASLAVVPLVPRHFIEANGDEVFNQKGLGSGPFRVLSYAPDTEVRSERFDDYFRPQEAQNRHKPWVKELRQLVKPEPAAQVAAMEAGEVDILLRIAPELGAQFEGRGGFQTLYDPGLLTHHIYPNTLVPTLPDGSNPFRDIRVRQAMNHAIDLPTIVKTLATGKERRSYGIGSLQFGALPLDQATPLNFEYDPQKAKSLMADAGYGSGFEVNFYGTKGFSALTDNVALTVQQQLEAIGIRTKLTLEPTADFRARFAKKDTPGLYYYFGNQNPDPAQVINALVAEGGTLTVAVYPETGIQKKVEAQRLAFEPAEREKILQDLSKELYTNASWIFLHEEIEVGVMRDGLEWDLKGNRRELTTTWAIRPLTS